MWSLQVGITRTASTDASGMQFSVGTGTLGTGSLLAGEMLLEDGSYAGAYDWACTRHVHAHVTVTFNSKAMTARCCGPQGTPVVVNSNMCLMSHDLHAHALLCSWSLLMALPRVPSSRSRGGCSNGSHAMPQCP